MRQDLTSSGFETDGQYLCKADSKEETISTTGTCFGRKENFGPFSSVSISWVSNVLEERLTILGPGVNLGE